MWFWDVVADVQEWTERCKIHLGLPPGEKPSQEFFYSVVHSDDRERVRALVDRSLADRTDDHTVYRIVHPDGTHHWLAAMGHAHYDAKGTPISMGGVTIDVTRLTELKNELRASEALSKEQAGELESAKRQYQLLAENATDVVVQTDGEGVIRWITPSVRMRIGCEPDKAIGTRFSHLVHPNDWNRVRVLKEETRGGSPAEAELRQRIVGDGFHWFSVSMRPLFDAHQAVVGRVAGWRDIHRFKQINDTHGHAAGDAVLRDLADRIRGCLRTPEDIGARIGGDEFMVVLHGVRDVEEASRVAEHLRRRGTEPVACDGGTIQPTLSIGVTRSHPHEGIDALLARADDAMYQAKDCGRNRVRAAPPSGATALARAT